MSAEPNAWWSDEQTVAAMLDIVAQSGADRGQELFLRIAEAFEPAASPEVQDRALVVADETTLALIAECEEVADDLRASREQRRKLIEDATGACRGRVMELAAQVAPGGRA